MPDDLLIKTYCHLIKVVIPRSDETMELLGHDNYAFMGVRKKIDDALEDVSNELAKRNINTNSIRC